MDRDTFIMTVYCLVEAHDRPTPLANLQLGRQPLD